MAGDSELTGVRAPLWLRDTPQDHPVLPEFAPRRCPPGTEVRLHDTAALSTAPGGGQRCGTHPNPLIRRTQLQPCVREHPPSATEERQRGACGLPPLQGCRQSPELKEAFGPTMSQKAISNPFCPHPDFRLQAIFCKKRPKIHKPPERVKRLPFPLRHPNQQPRSNKGNKTDKTLYAPQIHTWRAGEPNRETPNKIYGKIATHRPPPMWTDTVKLDTAAGQGEQCGRQS